MQFIAEGKNITALQGSKWTTTMITKYQPLRLADGFDQMEYL